MLKFNSQSDIELFLCEIGKTELLPVDEEFRVTNDLYELYIRHRRGLVPKLKDFRRSQLQKENWRTNRYSIMRGIKNFSKTTKSKRFHRALGKFLATRDIREAMLHELTDLLKAISSLKTHLFIEGDYYRPLSDYVDYEIMIEETIPTLCAIEEKLIRLDPPSKEEWELLFSFIDEDVLIEELTKLNPNAKALYENQDFTSISFIDFLDIVISSNHNMTLEAFS